MSTAPTSNPAPSLSPDRQAQYEFMRRWQQFGVLQQATTPEHVAHAQQIAATAQNLKATGHQGIAIKHPIGRVEQLAVLGPHSLAYDSPTTTELLYTCPPYVSLLDFLLHVHAQNIGL